ncbi:MAG: DoxX family protein [Desulfobacterales bacterium RIFOXYA12_FULL_46_15]|nr:MAG: DoxX family protein [Desulfobacula sp. GWF2_41_7]OGR24541.1 MAG: DoxX family protein [Desulfobacterales bacterium RIFOXYA12_FULL_46_15]
MSGRFSTWIRHPFSALMVRFYIGGLFIYASLNKINFPAEFSDNIASYLLVPHFLVNPMAVFLPWIELVSGVCLVAGIRVRASAAVISTLLGTFTIALTVVLLKKTPIDCGCFQNVGDPVSRITLFRDLLWLAMGVYVFRYDSLIHLDRLFMIRPEDLDNP